MNLLNAVGEAVMETGRAGQVRVWTAGSDEEVTISVQEQAGSGERAGNPESGTRNQAVGITAALLDEQGGKLSIENRPEGTVYQLRFPAVTTVQAHLSQPAPDRSYTALVIESESSLLEKQLSYLSNLGIQASGVASTDEAIVFLASRSVDLVVLDQPIGADSPQHRLLADWIGRERPELVPRLCLIGSVAAQQDRAGRGKAASTGINFEEFSRKVLQVLQK